MEVFKPDKHTRILEVGGLPRFWMEVPIPAQITLLNIHALDDYEASFMTPNQKSVIGDGTKLPYDDQEFDIVFSNSVIEHVGTERNQILFAQEAGVSAKRIGSKPRPKNFLSSRIILPFLSTGSPSRCKNGCSAISASGVCSDAPPNKRLIMSWRSCA
jgi:hypothetical protein